MRSQRLTVATNFLPFQAVRLISFLQTAVATNFFRYRAVGCCAFSLVGNAHRAFRGGKHGRMPCGRATGKHKIDGTNTQCKFQPMQCPSVERTFCNRLYVYGRGRRRCGGPTIQADRFPLVGNAHRAFRGKKHGRMPFGRSTKKHKINESILCRKNISTHALSVRRTHVS